MHFQAKSHYVAYEKMCHNWIINDTVKGKHKYAIMFMVKLHLVLSSELILRYSGRKVLCYGHNTSKTSAQNMALLH